MGVRKMWGRSVRVFSPVHVYRHCGFSVDHHCKNVFTNILAIFELQKSLGVKRKVMIGHRLS